MASPVSVAGVYVDAELQVLYAGAAETFTLGAVADGIQVRVAEATVDFGDGRRTTVSPGCGAGESAPKIRHVFTASGHFAARVTAASLCAEASTIDLTETARILVLPSPPASADKWPTCTTFQVEMSGIPTGAGLGHVGVLIRLQNRSSAGCTLSGYPGVQLVGPTGDLLHTEVRQAIGGDYLFPGIPPHRVALAPGAFAAFDLGYEDNPFGPLADKPYDIACPAAVRIRITLPETGEFGTARIALAPCNGLVEVSPLFPGRGWVGFQ